MIGIGCVDKTSDKVSSTDIPIKTNVPIIKDAPNNDSSDNSSSLETRDTSDNVSSPEVTEVSGNVSPSEVTEVSGNMSPSEVIDVSNNTVSPEVTDLPTEDTSVTEIFNIGDEKSVLGVNMTLVNITDYDNNIVTLLINGVEYTYDSASETVVQANGIEVIDVITLEDDKTAEITVDYIAS